MRKAQILCAFLLCANVIFAQNCPPSTNANIHIVQPGETLYRIAAKYGLSVSDLTAMNDMTAADVLSICKQLTIKKADDLQPKGGNYIKNDFSKRGLGSQEV